MTVPAATVTVKGAGTRVLPVQVPGEGAAKPMPMTVEDAKGGALIGARAAPRCVTDGDSLIRARHTISVRRGYGRTGTHQLGRAGAVRVGRISLRVP